MRRENAFWDSSALVPLCVHETASQSAHSHIRKYLPVVWWGSPVEIHGAIARLHRLGKLQDRERRTALARLAFLSQSWREILPADSLRECALQVLDNYPLRSADSLQLAAALTWCQQRTVRRTFVCGDERLSNAAASAGFSVLQV